MPLTSSFFGFVDSSTGSCCNANSCVFSYVETESFSAKAGQSIQFNYRSSRIYDWYESAFVLYEGETGEGGSYRMSANTTTPIAAVRVVRGFDLSDTTESLVIPTDGEYFLAFFGGSYDWTGGTWLGSRMIINNFTVVS